MKRYLLTEFRNRKSRMHVMEQPISMTDVSLSDYGEIRSFHDFMEFLETRVDDLFDYVNITRHSLSELSRWFFNLQNLDKGGFSHAEVGDKYGVQQLDPNKFSSRSVGYKGIFYLLQRSGEWRHHEILLDVLAGNGTVGRMLEQLYACYPKYIGNDVSLNMVIQGILDRRLIYYSDIRTDFLKHNLADYGVSAYGSHHISSSKREEFLIGCYQKIKQGGTFILQDFEYGSVTAQWYNTCINTYRYYGHQYSHFTKEEMKALLIATGFRAISIHYLYDPFVFRLSNDISDEKAKQDFYGYLINLFALEKITDQIKSGNVKKCDLSEIFDRYFIVEQEKLEQCISGSALDYDKNFITEMLTIKSIDGERWLIAPRIALAAVGRNKLMLEYYGDFT